MSAALALKDRGAEPLIVERDSHLGGNAAQWHKLFPTFTPADEVVGDLARRIAQSGIEVRFGAEMVALDDRNVTLAGGERIEADATLVCTGFNLFDAHRKEEYGYGIYDNVFTTVDIERMMNEGKVCPTTGVTPERIAFLHCVGSRDEKVGHSHCSKVCCITGVKQAIELKKLFPKCEIYNFYMDIRMFGPGYEELYRTAQIDHNIHFVRGRISEASPTIDHRIRIKAEDTLIGRPLRMTVDMFILIVGMQGSTTNSALTASGLTMAPNGFMASADHFMGGVCSNRQGIFYAGAVTAPKNIGESINEGVTVAHRVMEYLATK